jgi:iron complex transport system ATP-binding protein
VSVLLQLEGVSVQAGARTLVRELSLDVAAGEVWALVGPNGAGKTMLLRTAAALRPPAAGAVRLGGIDAARLEPREAAERRSFLPQVLHDAFDARVLEVVLLGLHARRPRWSWEGEPEVARAMQALRALDAAHLAGRGVATLSGGERQRVAIAAMLLQEAPLLLLDEPAAHLDLQHQVAVLGHLAGLARDAGRAVVFSVHDVNLAARFATHVLLYLGEGRAIAGPAAQVLDAAALSQAFGHPVLRVQAEGRTLFVAA